MKLIRCLKSIQLTDKFLLIFMIILMLQSTHNLFFHEFILQENQSLDVVIRTITASIFGYFISSNFYTNEFKKIKDDSTKEIDSSLTKEINDTQSIQIYSQEIELTSTSAKSELENKKSIDLLKQKKRTNQQIIIVSMIGIFSLIILVISRNWSEMTPATIATLSQLRDFVSGSVGFLVGNSQQQK